VFSTVPEAATAAGAEEIWAAAGGVRTAVQVKPGAAALVTVRFSPITTGVVNARMLTAAAVGAVRVNVCAAELTLVDGSVGSLQVTISDALPC